MQQISYEQYISELSLETRQYVDYLLKLLSSGWKIIDLKKKKEYYAIYATSNVFFVYIYAYDKLRCKRHFLSDLVVTISRYGDSNLAFYDNYKYLYFPDKEIKDITPEDIIMNYITSMSNTINDYSFFNHLGINQLEFKTKVLENSRNTFLTSHIKSSSQTSKIEQSSFQMSTEALDYLDKLACYYKYLTQNPYLRRTNIIYDNKDHLVLANLLLLLSLSNNRYNYFLNEKNINLDIVLEYLHLPAKDKFISDVNNINGNREDLSDFNKIILGQTPDGEKRKTINVDTIVRRLLQSEITKSETFNKIYYSLTNSETANFINEVDQHQLASASPEVCNLLLLLSNYYYILKGALPNDIPPAPIAIIIAAMNQDDILKEYLSKKYNITPKNFISEMGMEEFDFHYNSKINISLINQVFKDYINPLGDDFSQATVYSIFENAIQYLLNNNAQFKSYLFRKNIEEIEFKAIAEKINTYKKEKIEEERRYQEKRFFIKCSSETLELLEMAVKVYKYIWLNKSSYSLIENEADAKELAIVLGLFYVKDENIKYFKHNGIYLSQIYEATNLPEDLYSLIKDTEIDKKEMLMFSEYVEEHYILTRFASSIDNRHILNRLIGDCANNSIVLEIIANYFYPHLVEEIKNQRTIPLELKDELDLLKKIEIPQSPKTIADISCYGNELLGKNDIIQSHLKYLYEKQTIDEATNEVTLLSHKLAPPKQVQNSDVFGLIESMLDKDKPPMTTEEVTENEDKMDRLIISLEVENETYTLLKEFVTKYIELLEAFKDRIPKDYSKKKESFSVAITQAHMILQTINNNIGTYSIVLTSLYLCRNVILPGLLGQDSIKNSDRSKKVKEMIEALKRIEYLQHSLSEILNQSISQNNKPSGDDDTEISTGGATRRGKQ